jgi:hypothetical protein
MVAQIDNQLIDGLAITSLGPDLSGTPRSF